MNIKRSLALLLTFLLLFSNSVFAAVGPKPLKEERTKPVSTQELISTEDEQTYKLNDKVRVIVEIDGDPAITYATNKGKKFSELTESKKVELHNKALNTQQKVKQTLTSNKVKMEFKEKLHNCIQRF